MMAICLQVSGASSHSCVPCATVLQLQSLLCILSHGGSSVVIAQVRNSASGIVQLTYGDDGLDPVSMEGKDGTPIDFVRYLSQVKASTPNETAPGVAVAAAAAPLPGELLQLLEQRVKLRGLVEGSDAYSGLFMASLKDFILKQVS